jgi:hypothetical protein
MNDIITELERAVELHRDLQLDPNDLSIISDFIHSMNAVQLLVDEQITIALDKL